jgi:hypothetical protein
MSELRYTFKYVRANRHLGGPAVLSVGRCRIRFTSSVLYSRPEGEIDCTAPPISP